MTRRRRRGVRGGRSMLRRRPRRARLRSGGVRAASGLRAFAVDSTVRCVARSESVARENISPTCACLTRPHVSSLFVGCVLWTVYYQHANHVDVAYILPISRVSSHVTRAWPSLLSGSLPDSSAAPLSPLSALRRRPRRGARAPRRPGPVNTMHKSKKLITYNTLADTKPKN